MLNTSLERMGGLFDREFLVAYWSPVLVGSALLTMIYVVTIGYESALHQWAGLNGVEQVVYGVAALIAITVLAYILSTFTRFLIQAYEGYSWPFKATASLRIERARQIDLRGRREKLYDEDNLLPAENEAEYTVLYARSFEAYPLHENLVRPTRFGNILAAGEEYSSLRYGMDFAFWWPRLIVVAPETMRAEVSAAITPMIALLNLASILGVLGVLGGVWVEVVALLQASNRLNLVSLLFMVGGIALARIFYDAATTQARRYAQTLRTTFDLYRFDLLEQMRVPLPPSPAEERKVWDDLYQWLFYWNPEYQPDRYQAKPSGNPSTNPSANTGATP